MELEKILHGLRISFCASGDTMWGIFSCTHSSSTPIQTVREEEEEEEEEVVGNQDST